MFPLPEKFNMYQRKNFCFQKKDIKDRLFMSETEGIVLSPQRRSFITGCQVTTKDPPKDSDNPSGHSSNAASKSSSQDRGERGSEK